MPLPNFGGFDDGTPIWLMMPNAIDNNRVELQARGDPIETPSGARMLRLLDQPQRERYEVEYIVESHAELNALLAFVKGREAQRKGFWLPTWQWEFDIRSYELPNFGSYYANYTANNYAEYFFPLGKPYRFVIMMRGDTATVHMIDAVMAGPIAGVARMHMQAQGSIAGVPQAAFFDATLPLYPVRPDYRLLWLRYGRWDSDEMLYEQFNGDGAGRVVLPFIEVPKEVPV